MALQLGDTAPDFEAETTEGTISFHDWIGDSWAVLFSHPKDFTPVCTTELGYMAKIKPEFDQPRRQDHRPLGRPDRRARAAGRRTSRRRRARRPTTRSSATPTSRSRRLYGMLPADVAGDPPTRTPADNQTVRNVFVIGPDKKIKLILVYPMTTGRNFDEVLRVIDSLQLTAKHKVATPVELEAGRGRDHRRLGLERRGEGDLPGRLGVAEAVHPDRPAADGLSRRRAGGALWNRARRAPGGSPTRLRSCPHGPVGLPR